MLVQNHHSLNYRQITIGAGIVTVSKLLAGFAFTKLKDFIVDKVIDEYETIDLIDEEIAGVVNLAIAFSTGMVFDELLTDAGYDVSNNVSGNNVDLVEI